MSNKTPADSQIQAAIRHFGLAVTTVEAVPESFSSIVRVLTLSDGAKVVLKLPFNQRKLQRETRILTLLQGRLPVPTVLASWQGDETTAGALLLSWLPGAPATNDATPALAYGMGELLAQLHQVRTRGFGDDYDTPSQSTDWQARLVEYISSWETECSPALPTTFVQQAVTTYQTLLQRLPPPDGPCLVHMDYRPGNILVDGEAITGLIDFESARGGSAERDFVKMREELWLNNPATEAPFLSGYAAVRPLPDLAAALPLNELQNALASLAWAIRRDQVGNAFWQQNMQVAERLIRDGR
ncbi:MAG: aminoglycoside phosphotransferase family protein [Caldilineaceae bacterium]